MAKKGKKQDKVIELFGEKQKASQVEGLFLKVEKAADEDKKVALLQKILEIDPENVEAKMLLVKGETFMEMIEQTRLLWEEVKPKWQQTEQVGWANSEERPFLNLLYQLAQLYVDAGRMNEALNCFEQLYAIDEWDYLGVRFEMMAVYCKTYRLAEAKRLWMQLGEERHDEQIMIPYMVTLLLHGEVNEARQVFEQLVQLNHEAVNFFIDWEMNYGTVADYCMNERMGVIEEIQPLELALAKLFPLILNNFAVFEFFANEAEAYRKDKPHVFNDAGLIAFSKQLDKFVEMCTNPIFNGISTPVISQLLALQIDNLAAFAEYREEDILAIKGIGPATIKKLKANGVRFKQ